MKARKSSITASKIGWPVRNAVDSPCTPSASLGIDAARVDIGVEAAPGRHPAVEFERADLDDAVAIAGHDAGGFGVQDDLAHGPYLARVSVVTSLRDGAPRRDE